MSNSTWVNDDGLLVRYGLNQGKRDNKAGHTSSNGKEQELVLELTLTGAARTLYSTDLNNDGTKNGFSGLDATLPAGAIITGQRSVVLETPAGGTNYAVGTYVAAGTVVDADGIRTTAGADGALVGTQLAAAAHVTAVTTGTYTAGKVKVIINYYIA